MDKTAAQRVMNATQLTLVFRHLEPADARAWSTHFGTYGTQRLSRRLSGETGAPTGDWSVRDVVRPYVPAEAIGALPRGVCYARLPGLARPVALRVPRAAPTPRPASGVAVPPEPAEPAVASQVPSTGTPASTAGVPRGEVPQGEVPQGGPEGAMRLWDRVAPRRAPRPSPC